MPRQQKSNQAVVPRRTERGAALISVLLISALLMSAGGVLLLTTSMSATSPIEATAEMQAYYAAEAGLQRTLNVLRSKDIPAGTMPAGQTKLTFRDVVLKPTLASWIPFDGPDINGVKTTLVGTNAFSVAIIDPDDQGPVPLRKITLNPKYQPMRLSIQLTGYGPRRARKILNMLVANGGLSGYKAPATITLRGSDALPIPPPLSFDTGDSASVRYTGNDAAGGAGISAFAVTAPDVLPTLAGIQKPAQVLGPPVSVLGPTSPIAGVPPTEQPDWLDTADAAREFVASRKGDAVFMKRYFTEQPAVSAMGTQDAPKFTFVDGNVDLGSGDQGAGFLLVTGKLTMQGNTSFRGIIFVLGEGYVERSGSGNGVISGGLVIAKFGATGGFGAPFFNSKGGGSSRIEYNSDATNEGLSTVPGFEVLGVVEKEK